MTMPDINNPTIKLPSFNELCAVAEAMGRTENFSESPRDGGNIQNILNFQSESIPTSNPLITSPNQASNGNGNYILANGGSPQPSPVISVSGESTGTSTSNYNHDELQSLATNIGHSLESYRQLVPFLTRLNEDLLQSVTKSATASGTPIDEMFTIPTGHLHPSSIPTFKRISTSELIAFLGTIPTGALHDVIKYTHGTSLAFQPWLQFQEKDLAEKVKKEGQINTNDQSLLASGAIPQSSSELASISPRKFINQSTRRTSDPAPPIVENNGTKSKRLSVTDANIVISTMSAEPQRVCKQCFSSDTPEWRRGPYGPRSLCNACGLFYGKLSKKFGRERAAKVMEKRRTKGDGCDRRIPTDQ